MNLKSIFTTVINNRLLTAIFFFLSLTAFYGCNNNDELEDEARRREEAYKKQLAIDTVTIKNYILTKNIPNAQRSPYKSGLFYAIQKPGTGDSAALGKTVVTHYILTNLQGDTLDTSRKPRSGQTTITPLTFQLGRANILSGFQEGVSLMRVGERSLFFLPSGLAYGDQAQEKIPANSVLIFDIELLEVK
ncbi:FKBP-type peptidyl-prolyl cis-trans isomerase [Adhaeribacter radiodurans]|uniref:Peptidyl-prolyl cis-trans isomerase n=1 Tax=Adhaeribacter radiodurans TaxID=2745197 RepID=A0A7L7L2M7_9BACT|nr:FKBP-type peptidyl-prolyl cis-trans isomerase [Adhaeribacter radiodurans]QMU27052.1 FKBP-type peptidyl-prolyl cis-trans isomerase [Adhaeribacter radiodurans]